MLVAWWAGLALAAPPDREAALVAIPDGVGAVERMAVSPTGDVVVGRTAGDLQGWLLDIDSWQFATFGKGTSVAADCSVTGAAAFPVTSKSGGDVEEIWVSCGEGDIYALSWDGEALTQVRDDNGDPIVLSGVDDTLSGIWVDDDPLYLYALHVPTGDVAPKVHVIEPLDATVDEALSGYPVNLIYTNFVEGVIESGRLFVAHGGQDLSVLALGIGNASAQAPTFSGAVPCDDLAPSPLGGVYCVGAGDVDGGLGAASEYRPLANQWFPLGLGELPDPLAIVASREFDTQGNLVDGWLAITGLQVKVWEMDENGAFPSVEPYFEGPENADNPIQDMVADDNYLFGGGEGPNLHIDTSRPWVYPAEFTVDPSSAVDGETVTIQFSINQDSSWSVYVGGTREGNGFLLASGDAYADQTLAFELPIDGQFEEGDNHLYLVATNSDGATGHARATLNVDNPPDPPALTDGNLQFSNEALVLTFDGIPDKDLDRYEVYVSEAPFTAADWPTGGPAFDGDTNLTTPIRIDAAPSARVTRRIEPLQNEVTYYVAVRAWDQAGKEGPMSRVIKGTPHETFTASDLAGETGGSPCSTGPAPTGALPVAFGALLLALRRRSAALVAAGALLGTSGAASAQDAPDKPQWLERDETPARANFEVRYGVINLKDPAINDVYDLHPHNLLQAEVGAQIFRFGEVDFGMGFFQELAFTVTDSLDKSSDRTMLTWWPFYIDATLRAHVLDEQPVVPFVRYGWDYVIWSEKTDNASGGKDTINGGKFGTHTGVGLNVLLDVISPKRASFLEARTGINDSWLTLEYRHQAVDGRNRPWSGAKASGFDFGGNAFQVGLKLDW